MRAGRVDAVAAALATGFATEQLAWQHLRAVQHQQPVDRAHETELMTGPAHGLGHRQAVQCILQQGEQQFGQRSARLFDGATQPFTGVGLLGVEGFYVLTHRARKTQRSPELACLAHQRPRIPPDRGVPGGGRVGERQRADSNRVMRRGLYRQRLAARS